MSYPAAFGRPLQHPHYHAPPPPPPPPPSVQRPIPAPPPSAFKNSRFRHAKAETAGYAINYPIQPVNDRSEVPEAQQALVPQSKDIVMKKYATSVDERNFLTVYEYMVNNQWVIWDYYTGYVHLTGLWKAIGNSKADIVKLVDNSPDLEPVIKRVRGGFLKIQGTWVPFNVAKALASRTCYHIRYALIPVFGDDFPDSCLTPGEPGFGQLQLRATDSSNKRRRKRTSSVPDGNNMKRRRTPDAPPQRPQHRHTKSATGVVTRTRKRYSSSSNNNSESVIDSSHSSSSEEEYQQSVQMGPNRRRAATLPSMNRPSYLEPTPLPEKLTVNNRRLSDSPQELLQALHATRSLQQFSVGRRWSFETQSYGGGFECGGKLWRWDGKQDLSIVGLTGESQPPLSPSSSSSNANTANSPQTPEAQLQSPMPSPGSSNITPRFVPNNGVDMESHKYVDHVPSTTTAKRSVMDINGLLS